MRDSEEGLKFRMNSAEGLNSEIFQVSLTGSRIWHCFRTARAYWESNQIVKKETNPTSGVKLKERRASLSLLCAQTQESPFPIHAVDPVTTSAAATAQTISVIPWREAGATTVAISEAR